MHEQVMCQQEGNRHIYAWAEIHSQPVDFGPAVSIPIHFIIS